MENPVPRIRQPRFSFWIIPLAAIIAEGLLLLALWPATAVRGWSIGIVAVTSLHVALATYVAGELLRWRFRISLKVLMALVALVCAVAATTGVWQHRARDQRQRAAAIASAGGIALFDFDGGYGNSLKTKGGWIWPDWLRDLLGNEFFGEIEKAVFTDPSALDPDLTNLDVTALRDTPEIDFIHIPVTDAGLARLSGLDHVRSLALIDAKISDAGLDHLRNLRELELLWLTNTAISDDGLRRLKDHTQLRHLLLHGTKVTNEGVAELQRAVPVCQIHP